MLMIQSNISIPVYDEVVLSAECPLLGWKYLQAAFLETKRSGQGEQTPASDGCGTRYAHFEGAIAISSCGTEPPRAPAGHYWPCCAARTPLPSARPSAAGGRGRSAAPSTARGRGRAAPCRLRAAAQRPERGHRGAAGRREGQPALREVGDGRTTRGEAGKLGAGWDGLLDVQMSAETANWLWSFWSFPDTAHGPHSSGHTKFA